MSSDERLLLELQVLCAQSLEATYKSRLEAVALFLQRRDKHQIEHRAQASLRTVQRWARRARQFGPGSLSCRARNCQTSKLSDEQRVRMAVDLKAPPASFRYTQPYWTAALLMRHVRQNYGVRFSLRHCRRLLDVLGVRNPRASTDVQRKRRDPERGTANQQVLLLPQPLGDFSRKRRALERVKRLASSGMPLQPLAYTLFDVVHDAVPHDEASPGLAIEALAGPRWIIRGLDYDRWFPHMQKYLLEATPEVSGFRPPSLLPQNPLTVLPHEQIVRPNYYSSEGYNEFFRHMGMHHGLLTVLRDEQGHFVGYYPVFRSDRMRAFTRDDVDFFKAAAAHIAHGIGTASLIAAQPADDDGFEPFRRVPLGVVVMDHAGKVLSVNRAAQSLFRQFAMYDNWGTKKATSDRFSEQLLYVAHHLRAIFGNHDEIAADANAPIVRIYSHRTGATLRLSGFASDLGVGHFTVLIELGETERQFRQRLVARYSLSGRQAEILILLRRGATRSAIAARLQTRPSALKSSLRELRLKLDLPNQSSLREFARSISSN